VQFVDWSYALQVPEIVIGGIGFKAREIAPLKEVTESVTVVLLYVPAVVLTPYAIQCPPPNPAVFELSAPVGSVVLAKLAFAHVPQLAVFVALLLFEVNATTNVSAIVVTAPGMTPEVSLTAESFPPAPISQGFPDVITPEKQ
jgi:hypothetical protein